MKTNNVAAKCRIGSSYTDFEIIYLPVWENFLGNITPNRSDYPTQNPSKGWMKFAYHQLKKQWENESLAYGEGSIEFLSIVWDIDREYKRIKDSGGSHEVYGLHRFHDYFAIHLCKVKDKSNTSRCSGFYDMWCYEELMIESDLYDRPFDENTNSNMFCSLFAENCMKGDVYSKDFMYYHCESCDRYVCGQNPSNGYMSQVHIHDGYVECNKCYNERMLEDGLQDHDLGDGISGGFFDTSEIKDHGWELHEELVVGYGRTGGYVNPDKANEMIDELIDSGKKVLVNIDSMAIGGMGGYIEIYTKEKENKQAS